MNKQYTFFSVALLALVLLVQVRPTIAETIEPVTDSKTEDVISAETKTVDESLPVEEVPVTPKEAIDVIGVTVPQSSAGLSEVISKVTDRLQGKTGTDFCRALITTYGSFTEDAKRSLAWSPESYESILDTKLPSTASGAHRTFYEQTLLDVREANTALQALHTSTAMDTNAITQAFVRSALLSYIRELSQPTPEPTRIDTILGFLENTSICLEVGNVNTEHDNFMTRIRSMMSNWQNAREHVVARAEALPTETVLEGEGAHLLFIESVRGAQDEPASFFPATVNTQEELQKYIEAFIDAHPEITKVIVVDDMLKVYYHNKGKLLGFIPVSMNTRADVLGDDVKIRFPWYGFLTSKERLLNGENLEKVLVEEQSVPETNMTDTEVVPAITLKSLIEQHTSALVALAHELAVPAVVSDEIETPIELPTEETLTEIQ